jgi:hypothetical protein
VVEISRFQKHDFLLYIWMAGVGGYEAPVHDMSAHEASVHGAPAHKISIMRYCQTEKMLNCLLSRYVSGHAQGAAGCFPRLSIYLI